MTFNYNNTFNVTQKKLSEQGRKVKFAMLRKLADYSLNFETALSLFDTYVTSILLYSSEVWGIHSATNIEQVHIDFCKQLLGVKKSTHNASVYCELGRYPLKYQRLYRILKYWVKILKTDNCILKTAYTNLVLLNSTLKSCSNNWVGFVEKKFK